MKNPPSLPATHDHHQDLGVGSLSFRTKCGYLKLTVLQVSARRCFDFMTLLGRGSVWGRRRFRGEEVN